MKTLRIMNSWRKNRYSLFVNTASAFLGHDTTMGNLETDETGIEP